MRIPQRQIALAAAVAALLAASAALVVRAADPGEKNEKSEKAKPALTISTAHGQAANLPRQLAANGNIVAWQEASVGAQANGLVLRELLAEVGDVVKKGQVLARFAPETVQAELAQAKASLAETQAAATDASANAERARRLQGTDALSAQQFAQYQTAEQTALARLEAARAQLTSQQLRLEQAQVTAPDAGVVSARSATVGAVVPAGTELFRMVRQGRLEWRAEVTSTELAQLKPGMPVAVVAASGVQLKGRVRTIGPTVDAQTRAALVYVDLPRHADVKAGMFATGSFELGRSQALTVPQQAVVLRDGFSYVFKLGEGQRVKQLRVQTGRRLGAEVEIVQGLGTADEIAVQGAGFLNDGDLVKVTAALKPASSK